MNQYQGNPFAHVGNIVSGLDFIGRHNDLEAIKGRVIPPLSEGGSMVIVGIRRIGKSSLAYQSLIEQKQALLQRKLLPIWIYLPDYQQPEIFFRDLVVLCKKELEDFEWDNDTIRAAANKALKKNLAWTEHIKRVKRFFSKVHESGIGVIFILDEFDHARTLFNNALSYIHAIRDLSIYPDYRVRWVVISRRPIDNIESKTPISTLSGIFIDRCLGMWNEEDLQAFFQRFTEVSLDIIPAHKKIIDRCCGRHPYLLEMLGYHLVEMYGDQKGEIDVTVAFQQAEQKFIRYYDNIVDLLNEGDDKKYDKLLQILFGPIYGIEQTDVDDMIAYGLIKPNPEWGPDQDNGTAAYMAFSHHFQDYLRPKVRWVNLWPLLGETEQAVRRVIHLVLAKKYSQDEYDERCLTKMEADHSKLKDLFDLCRERQKKEKGGLIPSQDLLDYTYPRDLFSLIFAEWNLFQPIFGKQKQKDRKYWNDCAELLTKIRNPLAHHRLNSIPTFLYPEAKRYCEEILAITRTIE